MDTLLKKFIGNIGKRQEEGERSGLLDSAISIDNVTLQSADDSREADQLMANPNPETQSLNIVEVRQDSVTVPVQKPDQGDEGAASPEADVDQDVIGFNAEDKGDKHLNHTEYTEGCWRKITDYFSGRSQSFCKNERGNLGDVEANADDELSEAVMAQRGRRRKIGCSVITTALILIVVSSLIGIAIYCSQGKKSDTPNSLPNTGSVTVTTVQPDVSTESWMSMTMTATTTAATTTTPMATTSAKATPEPTVPLSTTETPKTTLRIPTTTTATTTTSKATTSAKATPEPTVPLSTTETPKTTPIPTTTTATTTTTTATTTTSAKATPEPTVPLSTTETPKTTLNVTENKLCFTNLERYRVNIYLETNSGAFLRARTLIRSFYLVPVDRVTGGTVRYDAVADKLTCENDDINMRYVSPDAVVSCTESNPVPTEDNKNTIICNTAEFRWTNQLIIDLQNELRRHHENLDISNSQYQQVDDTDNTDAAIVKLFQAYDSLKDNPNSVLTSKITGSNLSAAGLENTFRNIMNGGRSK